MNSLLQVSRQYLSLSDKLSLRNLSQIAATRYYCIDVNRNGRVSKPYPEKITSSLWRTVSRSSGQDLSYITKLIDRVNLAWDVGLEDHSELLFQALRGVRVLKANYLFKEKRDVVKSLEDLIGKGNLVSKRIKQKSEAKKIPSESKQKVKRDDRVAVQFMPLCQQFDCEMIGAECLECEMISAERQKKTDVSFKKYCLGLLFYERKLKAFLTTHSLSTKEEKLVQDCIRALQFGRELDEASDRYAPQYLALEATKTYREITSLYHQNIIEVLTKQLQELPDIGVPLPAGFQFKGGSHVAVMGIYGKGDEFYVTQCNTGGGSLGNPFIASNFTDIAYHFRRNQLPFVLKGEAVVTFGPYSANEVCEMIKKRDDVFKRCYGSQEGAESAFQSLYHPERRLPVRAPLRRFQIVGNCITASVKEWLVDVFQQSGQVELFNRIDQYGKEIDQSTPSLQEAEIGGMAPKRALNLRITEVSDDAGQDGEASDPWILFETV